VTDAVTVSVRVDALSAVVAALRVGVAELVRADRSKPAGSPAFDARAALALARALAADGGRLPSDVTAGSEFVTVGDGTRTGVPARTVHNWIGAGRVHGKRCECGRGWLVRLADVEREQRRRRNP
jgi:hypothetical protein